MCNEMGTVAALTACAAAKTRVGSCFRVEGKSCKIRGERLLSAAATRAVSCSMLYLSTVKKGNQRP